VLMMCVPTMVWLVVRSWSEGDRTSRSSRRISMDTDTGVDGVELRQTQTRKSDVVG
jgi:hypothetical protein